MSPRGASPAAKAAPHPRVGLNEFCRTRSALSLVAALASVEEADFASLRDFLQISDSALSRRASQLEEAKLVTIRRGMGKRPRTWLSLTPAGREAWTSHLAAIKAIAKGLPPSV